MGLLIGTDALLSQHPLTQLSAASVVLTVLIITGTGTIGSPAGYVGQPSFAPLEAMSS